MKTPIFFVISFAATVMSAMEDNSSKKWTLDTEKLRGNISIIMFNRQKENALNPLKKDSEVLLNIAQHNHLLADDLYDLETQGIFKGTGRQEIMDTFCKKWALKPIHVIYDENDFIKFDLFL